MDVRDPAERDRRTERDRVVEGGRLRAEKQLTVRAAPHWTRARRFVGSFKVTVERKARPHFLICPNVVKIQ